MSSETHDPEAPPASTGRQAARGAAVTVMGQVARTALQIGGIVVMARLLTPADYGLLAMVTAVITVGEVFRDFGLSAAAVQAKTLSRGQRDNLFWINTAIGVVLATLAFASAVPISHFYGQDDLVPLAQLLSVTFILSGASTQHRADLNRHLKLGWMVASDVLSQLVGIIVGVVLALQGMGALALGWMVVSQAVVGLVVIVAGSRWVPGLPQRGQPMRSFFRFGVGLLGSNLLAYGARSADSVVIGATLGPAPLGLYNRAMQLLLLPLNQLQAPATRVALPVLSRAQDDDERFAALLVRGQSIMLHGVALVIAIPAALAPPLFGLVLGDDWVPAAPVFRILAVGGFAGMAAYAAYWIFLARGLTGSLLRFSLVARPTTIGLLLLGSVWGLYGVAWAYAVTAVVLWPANYWWLHRATSIPTARLLGNGLRVVAMHGSAALVGGGVVALTSSTPEIVQLLLGGSAMLVWLGAAVALVPAVRRDLGEVRRIIAMAR